MLQECVQGVRRSWAGASLPWESAGGCRQEADFTVICLPGEAWVRLRALLVRAGAKLEYRLWDRREWARSVRMGLKLNVERLHHPEETLNPVKPWTFVVESRLA